MRKNTFLDLRTKRQHVFDSAQVCLRRQDGLLALVIASLSLPSQLFAFFLGPQKHILPTRNKEEPGTRQRVLVRNGQPGAP